MARYEKTTATVIATQIGTAVGGSGQISYHPVITYRYVVDGREFVNDRFTQQFVGQMNRGLVQNVLDKHPPQSSIDIFYNTSNPADSFVQKGAGKTVRFILYGMVVVALVIFAATMLYAANVGLL